MPAAKRAEGALDRTDWDRLRSLSEAEIERLASADPDNPATLGDDEWDDAIVGLPPLDIFAHESRPAKRTIHARFDSDVVAFFQHGGRGYQDRMNAVLRRYMEAQLSKKPGR